jgi:hypothetical protein
MREVDAGEGAGAEVVRALCCEKMLAVKIHLSVALRCRKRACHESSVNT